MRTSAISNPDKAYSGDKVYLFWNNIILAGTGETYEGCNTVNHSGQPINLDRFVETRGAFLELEAARKKLQEEENHLAKLVSNLNFFNFEEAFLYYLLKGFFFLSF